jgi:hypothetical protein
MATSPVIAYSIDSLSIWEYYRWHIGECYKNA